MLAYFRRITTKQVDGDEGASAVEYGLLVAAIAAIIILVVFALGTLRQGRLQGHLHRVQDIQRRERERPGQQRLQPVVSPDNHRRWVSQFGGSRGIRHHWEGGPSA